MVKSRINSTPLLLYSVEVGQGGCRIISSEVENVISFEPVIAPETDRRGITSQASTPRFSLLEDGRCLVFGVSDVFEHGRRTGIRRLNSMERYTSADYARLFQVLLFNAFPSSRNAPNFIAPVGIAAVPIIIYNNAAIITEMRNSLVRPYTIQDRSENTLLLDLQAKRLQLVPESYGALMHYAYDPDTLEKRSDANISGTTLILDTGYETTDFSMFEGLKFQRDRAESVTRAGMGVVTRAVHDYVVREGRSIDISRIDYALRSVAGHMPGMLKEIEPTPGVYIDVTEVYDNEIENLSARIAQEALTRFPEAVTRVVLAGGGAYHLSRTLRKHLRLPIEIAPDPEFANVLGGFTALQLQANRIK